MDYLWLCAAFFGVAMLYAAAGFGGGSSYLALLALAGLPPGIMRPIALLCNLVVTGTASISFGRAGVTPWRRALPLIATSVPAAFLGGRVQLPREQYLFLLGGLLVVAGLLMLVGKQTGPEARAKRGGGAAGAMVFGGAVGFVSGVVGIGGGIFLSPLLFLTAWDSARAITATTSLFIALNSLAGLAGQLSVGVELDHLFTGLLLGSVLLGGLLGTRLTLRRLSPTVIRNLAAALILLVGLRLVWTNAFILGTL